MEISGLARARVRRVVRARHRGRRPRGNFPAPWGAARRSVRVQGTRRRRGPARRRRRPRARLAAFRRGTVCSLLGGLLPDLVQLLSQTDPRRPVSVWPDAAAVASERCRVPTTQATAPTPPALGSRGALSASTGASCARCHRAPAPPERGGQLGAGSRSGRAAGLTDSTGRAELASGSHGPQGSPGVGAGPSRPPGPAPPHSSPRHRRRGSVDEDHRRPARAGSFSEH